MSGSIIVTILFAVSFMVLGAQAPKPLGWVAIGLALIGLLVALGVHM